MNDRAKKLIEALGWGIDQYNQTPFYDQKMILDAASEYDKLAEQAEKAWQTRNKVSLGFDSAPWLVADHCRGYASELRAMIPKEKTQLEKDVEELQGYAEISSSSRTILYILEQLKRQGKE